MAITIEQKKVMTPKFRVSFPTLPPAPARSYEGAPPKFGVTMLFDKKTDLAAMKKAVQMAIVEKWGKDKTAWPKKLRSPFRDGNDKADMLGYKDAIFVSASSKEENPPGIVDREKQPISGKELYAGSYARATLIAFAYDTKGNRGVSFSLQNLQKLGDGKKFSGKKAAEDEFDEVEDQSDDVDSYEDDEKESDDVESEDSDDLGF